MKTFFSKLMCKNSKLPSDSEAPKIHCPIDHNSFITHFCLMRDCPAPFICSKCNLQHPKDHKDYFVSHNAFYSDQLIQDFRINHIAHIYPSVDVIKADHQKIIRVLATMEKEKRLNTLNPKRGADEWLNSMLSCHVTSQKALRQYESLRRLAFEKNGLCPQQISRAIAAFQTLKQNLTAVEVDSKAILKKIVDDTRVITLKTEKTTAARYVHDLDWIMGHKPMNFFSLNTGYSITLTAEAEVESVASTFIPKFGLLAEALKMTSTYDVHLLDITTQKVVKKIKCGTASVSQILWIDPKNYLILCFSVGVIVVLRLSDGGKTAKVIAKLREHRSKINSIKYIENEDVLISVGLDGYIVLWNMKNLRKCGQIHLPGQITQIYTSIIYIPSKKLLGFQTGSRYVTFFRLQSRKVVSKITASDRGYHSCDLLYLPKKRLFVTSLGTREVQVWKHDKEFKKSSHCKTIETREYNVHSMVANEDESQLLFLTREYMLEMYSFKDGKTGRCGIANQGSGSLKLTTLDTFGKVIVANSRSKTRFVLNFSSN